MRIIAGKYRGRKLNEFKGDSVRPTTDRSKEGIFSSLQFDIPGSKFLDGFSGSGSMGIEALSRGADEVVFLDKLKSSCDITKGNLKMLNENARVYCTDCISFLKSTDEKFDIIFLDPPYKSNDGLKALEVIAKRDVLSENGYVVYESENAVNQPIEGLFKEKSKKYGISLFSFYKKVNNDLCVFAGSFDPFTNGHKHIVDKALTKFKKVVVALGVNENKKYTFSKQERLNMLNKIFSDYKNVKVASFDGYLVDFLKDCRTIYNVRGIRNEEDKVYEKNMYNFNKKLFPEIKNVYIEADENMKNISSTMVKEIQKSGGNFNDLLPEEIVESVVNKHIG